MPLNTLLKEIVHPLPKPEEGEKDKRIVKEELHRLFILKNVHRDLGDKDTQILLQTFTEKYERGKYDDNTTIIIVANYPVSSLPTEISKLFTVINLPVPDAGDIEDELGLSDSIVNGSFNKNLSYEANGYVFGATFMYPEEKFINHRKELVGALLGMQIYDIRKVLKTIQKLEDCIDPRYEDVPLVEHILKEKRQLVNNSSMLEVIRQDYIRTARSKGLKSKKVIYVHALKNALLPVITLMGLRLGGMVGGSVFVENVFVIPGMGSLLLNAINSQDIPLIQGCVLLIAVFSSIVNLITDIIYVVVDPRIKVA